MTQDADKALERKVVLFDLDGTLVSTEGLKSKAHVETVRALGGRVSTDIETLYNKIVGWSHEKTRDEFMRVAGIEATEATRKHYTATYKSIYRALIESLDEPISGVREFLERLAVSGYRMAVVSSSTRPEMETVLERTRIRQFFDVLVSAEDVTHTKPSPEPYRRALELLSVQPDSAVAFEDSQAGIESALAAGLDVFAVQHTPAKSFSGVCDTVNSFRDVSLLPKIQARLTSRRG